jgi:hypothetical protein
MKRTFVLSSAFAFAIGAGAAQAATRATPPFSVPPGGSMLCTAVNLSGEPRLVTIEVRDFAGNLVSSANANCSATNPKTVTVDPGEVSPFSCAGSGYRYCIFTIKGGGKNALRGVLRAFDGSNATIAVLPAE